MSETPKINKKNLYIPNPCHENWDQMSPTQQGRFCGVCQTEVVDFASMSDQQVVDFFANYQGQKLCARLQNPTKQTYNTKFNPTHWHKTAASLLLLSTLSQCHSPLPTAAATPQPATIAPDSIPYPRPTLVKGPPQKGNFPHQLLRHKGICGTIKKDGRPIAYANVRLIHNGQTLAESQTKSDGAFTLQYPNIDGNTQTSLTISASHMEYESTQLNIHNSVILPQPLQIELGSPTFRKGKIKVKD